MGGDLWRRDYGEWFIILWAGGLADLFRVRTLSVVFIGLISLSCIAMALNPSLLLLPVIIFLLRFTGQGMLSHIAWSARPVGL